MSRKTLIFLLLTAGVLYGVSRLLWPGKRSNLFTTELIQVDTALLDQLILYSGDHAFSLKREQEGWIASKGTLHLPAVQAAVNELLAGLSGSIQAHGVVTQNPEEWRKYGVEEAGGVRVQLFRSKARKEDFILGGQPGGPTYLRFSGQRGVYEVEPLPLNLIGMDFSAYRNPVLLEIAENEKVVGFEWRFPDTTYAFTKIENNWVCNGTTLDSSKVTRYLSGLRNLTSRTFADDFDEVEASRYAFCSLHLASNQREEPYTIECFRDSLRKPVYFFRSGMQDEVFFAEDSTGLYRRLFKNLTDFITETSRQ
ncbi:MAG: DUF4340 domain-containing protein [Saprospiraceae bacterium]|nr:DUF4340 domain-containing protein [Saprospiraceae bacterium]